MQPSRRRCLFASLALLAFLALASRTHADSLTITSSPTEATVEINGLVAGTTPYKTDFPGGYFHKTHTAFGSRLEHSMTLRVTKEGYLSQQLTLTEGPFEWVAVTGRHRGDYFLLKSNHFEVKLVPVSYGSVRSAGTVSTDGPLHPVSEAIARADERESNPATGSVTIASDPPGAEIYIDGKFVGQTPSTIQLSGGTHRIEVKSPGKRDWQRDLEVLKGSQLSLRPTLELSP